MSQIVRIRTRDTLMRPEVAQFIMRAATKCGYETGAAILADMALHIGEEWLGVFVGFADDLPKAALSAELPTSAFQLAATIHFAYSEQGPRQLVTGIGERARSWFCANGIGHVLVGNPFHSDRAFIRGLAHFGRGSRYGSVIRFDLDTRA